jgi:D-inositol-3-phosphate glycosyltransferase
MTKVTIIEPVGGHGGMDFYDYGLAIGLANNNCEVFYSTCNKTNVREIPNIHTLKFFGDIWEKSKFSKLLTFLNGYWKTFRYSKKNNIKIIHFQFFDFFLPNLAVVFFSFLFRFKRILTIHDIDSFKGKNYDFYLKIVCKLVDEIIVHNIESETALLLKGISKAKIHVIPHGNYLPFVNELPYEPSDGKLKILFFGQIKKVKGLQILLDAFKLAFEKNQNIHLTIAGKAWHEDVSQFNDFIKINNLTNNVKTIFEYIPNEEVESYFSSADVVVLPYTKIFQSGVLLLTMSYGRPVLTSNLAAFTGIIEDQKSGFVFVSEDTESLANKILEIEKDRSKMIDVQKNASILIKDKYDWTKIGKSTLNLYLK